MPQPMPSSQDKFAICFAEVIGEEGGYVNNPHDPGGETKFGIAKRYNPGLDIRSLTLDQARDIYLARYWAPARCDLLPLPLAVVYFDAVVNMGSGVAVKLMQSVLGEVPDGDIGPRTIGAMTNIHDIDAIGAAIVAFQAERGLYYASRAHFSDFGRGWLRRVIRGAMKAATLVDFGVDHG